MSTGGSSIYKGFDMIHDYSCSKCEEEDFNTEAQHFCSQCEHYLCDKCVNMHNGYHKKHTVYDRRDMHMWEEFSMDICDQHGKKLDIHCNNHQEWCCSVCVDRNHSLCASSHLHELARGFLETEEFKQLPAAVEMMRSRLNELKNDRMKDQASAKNSYKKIVAEIKALRKEINQILDQLEKKTVESLDSLVNAIEKSLQDPCVHMHDQMRTMVDKLKRVTGKHNGIQSYIGYRKSQTMLCEANILVHGLQKRQKGVIRFKSDESVLSFLRNLNIKRCVDSVNFMPERTDVVHVFKTQSSSLYSVKIKEDHFNCHIIGICELQSGHLVIADQNNNRVKLLNKDYKVIDQFGLLNPPQHLCHIAGEEIAITEAIDDHAFGEYGHEVYLLTVTKGKLQTWRKFPTDDWCTCIAHHQGKLYVGSFNALYQYTMTGQLVKKLYQDDTLGCTVNMCTVSPEGDRIYVTMYYKHKLVTLDKDGQVLCTLEYPELHLPSGVCVSPSGYVFVCGFGPDNVIQINRDGKKKLATVARKADGLLGPQSVWFSEQTSSLIVGNGGSDNLIVVKLC
ncbi:uncharacterized protein LOC128214534 [Mya arenaria]|uniref:uncharacterized protein LOC128214534 n=1 Tax=Mya arenaria TaxID=6604 RepID=UPI0022E58CF1|nr:uncharacterized protein LOC128214534 [Mya arenaria]